MSENKSLEEKVQLHEFRKDCRCEALNPLWEQIQLLDGLNLKCSEYGDTYLENPEKEKDIIFMNAFKQHIKTFKREIEKYTEIFSSLGISKHIDGNAYIEKGSQRIPISLEEAYSKSMQNLTFEFYCSNCKTKIPQIHYPHWEF